MKDTTETPPPAPKWEVLEESGPVCVDGFCAIDSVDGAPKPAADVAPLKVVLVNELTEEK